MTTTGNGTGRGREFSGPAKAALRLFGRLHVGVYRRTGGRVLGRFGKSPVLLLNTVGRKTGQRRTTPLLYLPDGEEMVVVASMGGSPKHPAWWLNLRDDPETTVEVGGRKVGVRAQEARGEEKARLWPRLVGMYPGYADYQRKTDREIPVVVLRPTGSLRASLRAPHGPTGDGGGDA